MKILIADDESILLKTIELKLRKEGYEVIAVSDGREAITWLAKFQPDIIITDLMMPYVSGLEIVSFVRKSIQKRIPIIMLTSIEQEKVVLEAFDLGVDDYITKPFRLNELTIRIKRLLSNQATETTG